MCGILLPVFLEKLTGANPIRAVSTADALSMRMSRNNASNRSNCSFIDSVVSASSGIITLRHPASVVLFQYFLF